VQPIDEQKPYWWDHLYDVFTRQKEAFLKWVMNCTGTNILHQKRHTLQQETSLSKVLKCRSLVQALNNCTETERASFLSNLTTEFGPCRNKELLMSWDDITTLHKDGFSIGSHGISHIPLNDLDEQTAHSEISDSAQTLRARIGIRPAGFCYPRGAYSPIHVKMVQQSEYAYAVSTQFGKNKNLDNAFTLKRRNMSDYQGVRKHFPVMMHLLELSGRLDNFLAARRSG
jgi:peptidoglycan/xylan/chitin deacetylase (PgdA/CDA1 family)